MGIEYPFFKYPDALDSRFKVIGNIHENPELCGFDKINEFLKGLK